MNKNLILSTVSLTVLIPMTACASNIFRNHGSKKEKQPEVVEAQQAPVTESIAPSLLCGEWVIKQVGDIRIERDENYPYINFVPEENSFYASNGCNVLNGVYTIDGDVITFHNVLATMKYCADTPFDTQINAVIADEKPVRYTYSVSDGEPLLNFVNAAGQTVMSLHKAGLDFLNGNWRVTSIRGEKFDDSEMSIFFDVEERKVHGNTGCNSFNGDIFVDPQNAGKISLSNMAVTMRMCPDIEQQSKFLVALEETTGAKLMSDGTVGLLGANEQPLIILVRK